jgi:adenine-specific DNA-methyltransferase
MQPQRAEQTGQTESTLNRRLRQLRQIVIRLKGSKMSPLQLCEAIIDGRLVDPVTREFFSGLPSEERHYWIASLYALRMSEKRRQRLAAYFTPPHLVRHVISVLAENGIEAGKDRILDPASGGAAFLVPLAAAIADHRRKRGASAESTLRTIESTLAGIEIDPDLSQLSRLLVADLLRRETKASGRASKLAIRTTDTLELTAPKALYDAIVANPPYGRIFRPKKSVRTRFSAVISGGYVNVYTLFIELALQWVRPGGVICLIVPMSFVGGPHFAALRKRILDAAHVLRLDPIDKRSDVFLDVLYDVCVLVLRKKGGGVEATPATSSLLQVDEPPRHLGQLDLPERPSDRIWAVPDGTLDDRLFQDGLATLHDYGYLAKTGYFVWNREQHRYRRGFTPRSTEVPLFWAHNIRPNRVCKPCDSLEPDRIGLVKIRRNHQAVVRTDAILLQRTTNRGQRRRLIAAIVRTKSVPGDGAFVSENHTIVLIPDPNRRQTVSLNTLCRLLNTAAVDARFRRMSGSVSVSTKALRDLPLPSAAAVRACFIPGVADDDGAESAYSESLRAKARESQARKKGARRDAR